MTQTVCVQLCHRELLIPSKGESVGETSRSSPATPPTPANGWGVVPYDPNSSCANRKRHRITLGGGHNQGGVRVPGTLPTQRQGMCSTRN